MSRVHPRRNRTPRFEALEGRLTLSTGVGLGAIPHQTHTLVMRQVQRQVPVSFIGQVTPTATTFTITNMKGSIGTERFVGHASGTFSATTVQGGDIYLTNRLGTLHLTLSPASVTQVGKRTRQSVPVLAADATGKYLPYVGETGTLTSWTAPGPRTSVARFRGVFTIAVTVSSRRA